MLTVILAGGASRRMGCDKADLPYGGTTLLQHLIEQYQCLGPVAVCVNQPGKYRFNGASELVDRFPDCGPLNGLVSAFEDTDADEVFLTAVDLPYGDADLALRLAQLRGDADACILQYGKKGAEPLFAVYGRRCGQLAKECLSQGKRSVFEIFSGLDLRLVHPEKLPEFSLDRILTNVNTPEEYRNLLQR